MVLAVGRILRLEMKVRILDCRHFHIGILVNQSGLDVVPAERFGHRPFLAFRPADIGIRLKVSNRAFDQRFHAAAVNVGRRRLLLPLRVQQRGKTVVVIAVRMGNKNLADFAEIITRLNDAHCHGAAGIDQIERAVDDQKVRRLRPVCARQRPACRAERDERGLCRRRSRERHRDSESNNTCEQQRVFIQVTLPFLFSPPPCGEGLGWGS